MNHFRFKMDMISDIIGTDFLYLRYRFKLIYNFISHFYNIRYRISLNIRELHPIESINSFFECAKWQEREIWDMFGISFKNHPDLRRILNDYGFRNYPLRKDFPLSGFSELIYTDIYDRIDRRPISLAQEMRIFSIYGNPWRRSAH